MPASLAGIFHFKFCSLHLDDNSDDDGQDTDSQDGVLYLLRFSDLILELLGISIYRHNAPPVMCVLYYCTVYPLSPEKSTDQMVSPAENMRSNGFRRRKGQAVS